MPLTLTRVYGSAQSPPTTAHLVVVHAQRQILIVLEEFIRAHPTRSHSPSHASAGPVGRRPVGRMPKVQSGEVPQTRRLTLRTA